MVLHVQKTLKTTIQKKLPKCRKFAREISIAEFRYSQTIYFFTVHSNFISQKFGQKNNKQRAKINEQRAKSNKQRPLKRPLQWYQKRLDATTDALIYQPKFGGIYCNLSILVNRTVTTIITF